jgi:pyridoxal phosphate enzyme (YggS family)
MAVNAEQYKSIKKELGEKVTLVAVSKTKPVEDIQALYELGQRDFGENYVQELIEKQALLPNDIRWHFIGHLQSNKVKYIAPFVHLIHGVDSYKLLEEINRQGGKYNRTISCLLQVHIAQEETKFGFSDEEVGQVVEMLGNNKKMGLLQQVQVNGLMGMASFSDKEHQVEKEFLFLKMLFDKYFTVSPDLSHPVLSMGMSGDYKLAIACGSNIVRVGSLLFGSRS